MSGVTRVAFEKWEGLGNDFVVVEETAASWSDARVRAVCDRRRGVGADGVLFVERGAGGGERPRMVVRNADGSRPEMCGNGIRCVAGWLAGSDAERGLEVEIDTDAGAKRCSLRGVDGAVEVSVAMGAARIEGALIVDVEGRRHVFTKGDVGNPHAITFEPYDDVAIDKVGPRVAAFPDGGTNVEFCRIVHGAETRIDVVVWERGVGRTLACGTGACAVAAAACADGAFAFGAPVTVRLPGGDLSIVVQEGSWEATMTGPARRVFTGELAFAGDELAGAGGRGVVGNGAP